MSVLIKTLKTFFGTQLPRLGHFLVFFSASASWTAEGVSELTNDHLERAQGSDFPRSICGPIFAIIFSVLKFGKT